MPNTGKPSLACHLCRERRVKCDLIPSGCLRCSKVGKACPGYRKEQDLLFHNQDKSSFASNYASALRKKRGHSTPTSEEGAKSPACGSEKKSVSSGCIVGEISQANLTARAISPTLPSQVVEDWNTYCIPILLHQFSAPADGSRFFGHFDFLPDLCRESNEESCFSFAIKVVVMAYINNLSHAPLDTHELAQIYGRALRSINAALEDPLERIKDSTIIAVWLLGIREILVSSPKKSPVAAPEGYHMHSQGLASLLRVRGPDQFSTRRGRNLFWMMYLFIQTHCLVANIAGPPQSLDWFGLLRPQLSVDDQLVFAVSNYNYKISLLCPRILDFVKHSHTDHGGPAFQVTSLFTEADSLQIDIQAWNAEYALKPADLASLYIHNILRAAILKLQHFIVLLISHMASRSNRIPISPNLDLRRQECIKSIKLLATEVLNSVPPALGDSTASLKCEPGCWANALRLLWPLMVIPRVSGALRQQREESKRALERIGRQMGIRLALIREPPIGAVYER